MYSNNALGNLLSRFFLLVLPIILFSHFSFAEVELPEGCKSLSEDALKLTIVARRDTIEDASIYAGVIEACKQNWLSPIQIEHKIYDDDSDGFRIISEIIEKDLADVIIGPTESGLYSDLVQFLKHGENKIPIISPIVTVRLGNDPENWFFRTNVDAANRAQTMYDYLYSLDVENIAMLYADRTFGEIAESAFRTELNESQRERFKSFRFQDTEDARLWIKQINQTRPEAIGIIGSREDVQQISPLIKRMHNEWNAYNPYVFTIVDTRSIKAEGSYFLSVGQPGLVDEGKASGELLDLSYDTSSLIFAVADNILQEGLAPSSTKWAVEFRKRFVGALSGSISSFKPKSRMEFSSLRNVAVPKVMTVKNKRAEIVTVQNDSGWQKAVTNWLEIRKRRYGIAPILNLSLVGFIVIMLTIIDLQKTHRVGGRDLLRVPFVMLMLLNLLVAVTIYIIMAEKQVFEWDSLFGAMLVAFGYSGLLKTTLFETQAGKAIGIKRYYENLVVWIYDRIRRQQFEKIGPTINYIAYANTRSYLRATLLESFGFAGGLERTKLLEELLDKAVKKELTIVGQCKVLAKEVLNEVSWKKLQERRIVPLGVNQSDILDPEPIVDESVNYCLRNEGNSLTDLNAMVVARLNLVDTEKLRNEFDTDFNQATTPKAKMAACIRWLILLDGYNLKAMVNQGLLPAKYCHVAKKGGWKSFFSSNSEKLERRQYPRIKNERVELEISNGSENIIGHLCDISEGGARIEIQQNVPEMSDTLVLTTKAQSACIALEDTKVLVMNRTANSTGGIFFGVNWNSLNRPSRASLNRYLSSILSTRTATSFR